MKFFDRKNADLRNANRILTEAARKRAERNEQLEQEVSQLRDSITLMQTLLTNAQADVLKVEQMTEIAAQRARLINEKDQELLEVRETARRTSQLVVEKDQQLSEAREAATKASQLVNEKDQELLEAREA